MELSCLPGCWPAWLLLMLRLLLVAVAAFAFWRLRTDVDQVLWVE